MTEAKPRKRAPKADSAPSPKKTEPVVPAKIKSGFANVREILSYILGAGVLLYGVVGASSDKAIIVVGAGLALLGAPIVGTIFEKKGP